MPHLLWRGRWVTFVRNRFPDATRILLLAGILVASGCGKPQVPLQESAVATPIPKPRLAREGTVYLLRRVAATTENSPYGFAEGSEVNVIEERSGKLLVETQGLRFEIDQEFATCDLDQRDTVLARAAEREAAYQAAMARRMQAEDKMFLAEENLQRRHVADAKIIHLHNAIDAAKPRRKPDILTLAANSCLTAMVPKPSEADPWCEARLSRREIAPAGKRCVR